jgi:3-deoxy-D-manno-octulosonic acid kinase
VSDTVHNTADGAIVYDTTIINQISPEKFTPPGWLDARPVSGVLRSAGRGSTLVVSDGGQEFVLRHFLRGGLPGRLIRDRYLWTGQRTTRSFAEWYLLAKLRKLGLPVPQPAAARYQRSGLIYRADLLTVRIPGIRSLAERITERPGDEGFWQAVGRGIHRFHSAGVCHADLNAYNVQLDEADEFYLLDFDRGRLLEPGVWQQKNLARLHRSLQKIKSLDKKVFFAKANWNQLLEGYFSASRSA